MKKNLAGKEAMDKKSNLYLLSLIIALIVLTATNSLHASPPSHIDPAAKSASDQLMQSSKNKIHISYHDKTGLVRFLRGENGSAIPQPSNLPDSVAAEIAARNFLKHYGALFGIKDPEKELKVMKQRTAKTGHTFIRFQQIHKGIPVIAGELIVQMDTEKNIKTLNGETSPIQSVNITPTVETETAKQKAIELVAQVYNVASDDLHVSAPELWIYNPALLGAGKNHNILVWRMEVTANDFSPINELILVNAHQGGIVLHFNQISYAKYRAVFDNVNNPTCGLPGCYLLREEGDPPDLLTDVNRAYDYTGDAYDFYLAYHGRDSIDNAGLPLISTVRFCAASECPYQNASWSSDYKQMIFGDGIIADDVVGHEMTHGVTSYESKLFYYMQSGAINESFSDLWGEFIDLTNGKGNDDVSARWYVGEDLPYSFLDGSPALRDMMYPATFSSGIRHDDPDRMTSQYYHCGATDNGGVHRNCGVNNKAVYLMTDGGTFNGKTISGIGLTKTAKIYYEVQVNYLTSGSDYQDLYDALQAACDDLIGSSGITASNCQQVKNALDAVEMNQQPIYCGADEAILCDSGSSNNLFFDDFENGGGNWSPVVELGYNPWSISEEYSKSGVKSLWAEDISSMSVSYLRMKNSVNIPPNAYLHFDHAYEFESGSYGFYDGGYVSYSTDGGSNWYDAGSLFIENGYNGTLYSANPLGSRAAFVGSSNGYISSRLNLSGLAGKNVIFGFRVGTDISNLTKSRGWYIDNVRIYTCETTSTTTVQPTTTSQPVTTSTISTTITTTALPSTTTTVTSTTVEESTTTSVVTTTQPTTSSTKPTTTSIKPTTTSSIFIPPVTTSVPVSTSVPLTTAPTTIPTSTTSSVKTSTTTLPSTTSSAQLTSTTTISPPCPATTVSDGDQEKLSLLRQYRDKVLRKSPPGRAYVKIFYKHSLEVTSILLSNSSIASDARSIMNSMLTDIQTTLQGKRLIITHAQMDRIISLLDAIGTKASLELYRDIQRLKSDLRQSKKLGALGIKLIQTH
jgi:Zn-dependent metalloprotease